MYNCDCYFCIYLYGLSLNGWHAVLCITNNRHDVTIATHAFKHFLIWVTTSRQPTKRRCSCVLTWKYTFICVYWWTRQRIQNTLIAVDRYLRLMGDKTIPDSAEPRLESFYPPFGAGIDLPHQGVVDSYNLYNGNPYTGKTYLMSVAGIAQCHYYAVSFLRNPHKRHPIAPPNGWAKGCLLWVQVLIYVLLLSLKYCMWYQIILDSVNMVPNHII